MMHVLRGVGLAATLVLGSIAAVPRASAASSSSTSAYVYIQIQGPEGSVYGFNASSTGQLSTISGSPFKPAGLIIGSTPTKFFTLGQDLIHSYAVGSNGAIQSQLEQIPYTDYSGNECGRGANAVHDAVLDHSGRFIYVMLENGGDGSCAAYQTFTINSDGSFDGIGNTQVNTSGGASVDRPSILGNESFAYADLIAGHSSSPIGFRRESSGLLDLMQFHETDPSLGGSANYTAYAPDASPAGNYVVLQLFPYDTNPPQLGSYTVDADGNLSTTNTSSNMPASSLFGPYSTFSPSGNLFALYADNGVGNPGNGIEIYKFNGAAPLTLYTTLLKGTPIDQVAWDSSNHLYAISRLTNELYVFTVTTTSVTQNTSWSIGSPFRMVVVSNESGSGAAIQFSTPLLTQTGTLAVDGQVTVDTSGNTIIQVTGQPAGKTYTVQFCPAFNGSNSKAPACFQVATLSTNGSGNGSSTVKFPQSGHWAGEFSVNDSSGNAVLQSGLYSDLSDETYMSTLLPETTTNGGAITASKTQDPLKSGTVSYSNSTAQFTLTGASPKTTFQPGETYGRALDSSQSYALPSFTTDSSGNGSTSVDLTTTGEGGDMFQVEGGSGAGFIGGFSIP